LVVLDMTDSAFDPLLPPSHFLVLVLLGELVWLGASELGLI